MEVHRVEKTLENKFEEELKDKAFLAKKQCKYNPTYFIRMLAENGGVRTAKILIEKAMRTGNPSDGYTTLFLEGRIDLTMEASVVKIEYHELFTQEEIIYCKELIGK